MRYILSSLILVLALSACAPDHPMVQCVWGDWEFRRVGDSMYYGASVPGTVHTDLLTNELIADPFYGENEKELQWIGEEEWEYRSIFFPDTWILEKENIELVFEGLDTYAEVYLNDELILEADNMFRTWKVDVKELLFSGKNELLVVFSPPGEINQEKAATLPYKLPDDRAFTRKSPYHFGWDWGPEFVTCGIWKPVHLKAWNDFIIENVHVMHSSVDENPLPLTLSVNIMSDADHSARIQVFDEKEQRIAFEDIVLKAGMNTVDIMAEIEDPELWWPSGLGEQNQYNWRVKVMGDGKLDERKVTFGIREIELVREPDDFGESFYFKVNGLPVFMKGANYVPQDNFLTRVDTARYEQLIRSVVDANMNMLRVWGGGFYENDIFYDLCDKYGILVWQDFMFACNMYPGDEDFLENVKQEAVDNVKRLSNHPSIALWCGNNESDEGWHNWGWQQALEYSEEDSARVWNDYLKIFHGILPEIVEKYDPGTIYHPSSPMTGWGREEAYTQGDVHYWGVWWGEYPFFLYKAKVGRFVSEYGFQGMPPIETIESFGGLENPVAGNRQPVTVIMESHQKHPRGTELIQKYMERDYIVPGRFEDYVYLSQVLQAEGMAQAFLTHRISQPKCMGTLYWQLNDCWPVTSWSGLDYYGRWKALHYHVKRAYEPIMVHGHYHDGKIYLFVVNDFAEEKDCILKSELIDFDGNIIEQSKKNVKVPGLTSILADTIMGYEGSDNEKLTIATLVVDSSIISRSFTYYVSPKEMKLPDPGLTWQVNGKSITIKTEKLARQVFLEARGLPGRFSDNFFDMAPGENREIVFLGDVSHDELSEILVIKSIYDTYNEIP